MKINKGGGKGPPITMAPPILRAVLLFTVVISVSCQSPTGGPAKPAKSFIPADNFLIDCGASSPPVTSDGRTFKTDAQSASFVAAKDEIQVSVPPEKAPKVPSPVYLTARVFSDEATYTFHLAHPGWHWIRLHFFAVPNDQYNLTKAVFGAATDQYVLLHSFTVADLNEWVLREFLINATNERLTIRFTPLRNSFAFINGIEVVSAPQEVIPDQVQQLDPKADLQGGFSSYAYQTAYRLNVGGSLITPGNDSLTRTWEDDTRYQYVQNNVSTGDKVQVAPNVVKYPEGFNALVAPTRVYSSAVHLKDARTELQKTNVTWQFSVDPAFAYLVRLHFCDIISKTRGELLFNVYVNEKIAIPTLDLSQAVPELAMPYYADILVNTSVVSSGQLMIQISPAGSSESGINDALLNGVEVLKMSNSVGSLDGEFGVDGSRAADSGSSKRKTVAMIGLAMMFGAFAGLGAMVVKWHKRPHDWEKRNSFSSWLLPIHTGNSSFMTNSKSGFGSHKSGYTFSSTIGLGRYFSLSELQDATKNFDEKNIIGVGGFGNVYLGVLEDGTKVAVKRGNPQSEQGINEFQTEIQMLSKLRHRHLVSLIGYCDENSEMILVYEYMDKGPFRDHIYGKDLPPLSWKQRLEICIGAARGLHYLHTGTATGIIHRDVKTTNILLDENFVAKVSDFGLSKDAPGMNQTHVSTAVKGSFGYLDPEYFRRQQLTDKSDVYSFGVVLLETLCARPALNPALPREQVNLAEWAMQWKRKGLLEKIIDPTIAGTINKESLRKFAEAAEKCLAETGVDRPSMGDVLWNLEYALQLQEANPPALPAGKETNSDEKGKSVEKDEETAAIAPAQTAGQDAAAARQFELSSTGMADDLFNEVVGKGR